MQLSFLDPHMFSHVDLGYTLKYDWCIESNEVAGAHWAVLLNLHLSIDDLFLVFSQLSILL